MWKDNECSHKGKCPSPKSWTLGARTLWSRARLESEPSPQQVKRSASSALEGLLARWSLGCDSKQGKGCWQWRPKKSIYYCSYILTYSVVDSEVFFSFVFPFLCYCDCCYYYYIHLRFWGFLFNYISYFLCIVQPLHWLFVVLWDLLLLLLFSTPPSFFFHLFCCSYCSFLGVVFLFYICI